MKKGTIISVNNEKNIARLKSEDGNEYPFLKNNLVKKELWEKFENGIDVTFELDKSKNDFSLFNSS